MSLEKIRFCEWYYNSGAKVYVHFDPKKADVPTFLKAQESVFFMLDRYAVLSPVGLYFGQDAMRAGLYFNDRIVDVTVPWSSVFAITQSLTPDALYDDALRPPVTPARKTRTGKTIPPYLRLVK